MRSVDRLIIFPVVAGLATGILLVLSICLLNAPGLLTFNSLTGHSGLAFKNPFVMVNGTSNCEYAGITSRVAEFCTTSIP